MHNCCGVWIVEQIYLFNDTASVRFCVEGKQRVSHLLLLLLIVNAIQHINMTRISYVLNVNPLRVYYNVSQV